MKVSFYHSLIYIFIGLVSSVHYGATSVNIASEGLAIVRVLGSMNGTGSLIAIDNQVYVLTPAHVIQDVRRPQVFIEEKNIDVMVSKENRIVRFKKSNIKEMTLPADVVYQNPLDDLALLQLNKIYEVQKNDDSELAVKLLYIASLNLHLCSSKNSDSFNCFNKKSYEDSMSMIKHSERLSWIYNNKVQNHFLNFLELNPQIEFAEDRFISGLYERIIKIPIFGGPGMSGGVLYYNLGFGGMVTKVHYDGFPQVYAIPTSEIENKLKLFIEFSSGGNDPLLFERSHPINSVWYTKIAPVNKTQSRYLFVNFNGQHLTERVSSTPLGSGGDPGGGSVGSGGDGGGSVGSGGGPGGGSPGSGGSDVQDQQHKCNVQDRFNSSYYSLRGLPNIGLETPLPNPFLVKTSEFYVGDTKVCRIKLKNDQVLQTNLAHYIHYLKLDSISELVSDCDHFDISKFPLKMEVLPLKNFRFYKENSRIISCNKQPIYQYDKSEIYKYKFHFSADGKVFKLIKENPSAETVFKIDHENSGASFINYKSSDNKSRAILFFYNEDDGDKLKPFSFFVQLEDGLIQAQW